jgi:hypothetical protein
MNMDNIDLIPYRGHAFYVGQRPTTKKWYHVDVGVRPSEATADNFNGGYQCKADAIEDAAARIDAAVA